jgi:hypothetical protein
MKRVKLEWEENLGTWEGKKGIFLGRVVKVNEFEYGDNITWRVLVDGNAVAMGMAKTIELAQIECERVFYKIASAVLEG